MKIIFRLCFFIILLALGFWLWTVLFPSDEAIIRKRLAKVAELMTFSSKEGTLARAMNVDAAAGYFARDVEIIVDTPAQPMLMLSGRDELKQRALAVRMSLKGLEVKFLDLNVTLSPDNTTATVDLTGEAHLPGDRDLFVQELKFFLRKIEGKWLIVRIETVRTLT